MSQTCTRCGKCCEMELCGIGHLLNPELKPPCPFLVRHGETTTCLFIACELARRMEPVLQKTLGVGNGCTYNQQEAANAKD